MLEQVSSVVLKWCFQERNHTDEDLSDQHERGRRR